MNKPGEKLNSLRVEESPLKDKAVPESAIVESSYSKFTTTRKGLA
jgi:hypothetical protein